MRAEALKGHLELLILAALQSEPLHGYAIIRELHRRSEGAFDLPEGTIYPALHRLERSGLLRSSWQEVAGRKRRVYRLTPKGGEAFLEQRDAWRRFSTGITAVLDELPQTP